MGGFGGHWVWAGSVLTFLIRGLGFLGRPLEVDGNSVLSPMEGLTDPMMNDAARVGEVGHL